MFVTMQIRIKRRKRKVCNWVELQGAKTRREVTLAEADHTLSRCVLQGQASGAIALALSFALALSHRWSNLGSRIAPPVRNASFPFFGSWNASQWRHVPRGEASLPLILLRLGRNDLSYSEAVPSDFPQYR